MRKYIYLVVVSIVISAGVWFYFMESETTQENLTMNEIKSQVKQFHESWSPKDYKHVKFGPAEPTKDVIELSIDGRKISESGKDWYKSNVDKAYRFGIIDDKKKYLGNPENFIMFHSEQPDDEKRSLDTSTFVYCYGLEDKEVKFFYSDQIGPEYFKENF